MNYLLDVRFRSIGPQTPYRDSRPVCAEIETTSSGHLAAQSTDGLGDNEIHSAATPPAQVK